MTSAFDVSKYILEQCGRMSAMKMQKLAFYAQAWHLVATDGPLFSEPVEAWEHGPIVRSLWLSHRGAKTVEATELTSGDASALSRESREIVDAVLSYYGMLTAAQLRQATHEEDPWRDAQGGTIDIDAMQSYYARALAQTSRHPSMPMWAQVVVDDDTYAELVNTAEVPDDVSSLVQLITRARAQLA
jgi:uncharacterized phage-associated protein